MPDRVCSIPDCGAKHLAGGLCRKHYLRRRKTGDPLEAKRDWSLERRFWDKVERGPAEDCWLWRGHLGRHGYGYVWTGEQSVRAHRASYMIHHGPIPDGLIVMHSCDVRACVNPAHLSAGTLKENTADMDRKGRRVVGVTRGEDRPGAILTEAAVRVIRASPDLSDEDLGHRYGVHPKTIEYARKGKTWTHIT